MDCDNLNHAFIYAMTMPLVFIFSCFILLPFFVFKFMAFILRYLSRERMEGKVVLITGASSGIGEQLVYEYAKKGASLVIVARRESVLKKVAVTARGLGSPDVLSICADVSNVDDCKRFVDEAVIHFGRLDHLVNNAGITSVCAFEDVKDITKLVQVMDVNFWGAIYPTYFAIPHLKKTMGKIVVNTAAGALLHPPLLSFYNASKAALISFYETIRVELGTAITITIVTPGFVESEMTQGKHLSGDGVIQVNRGPTELIRALPFMSSRTCGKNIVDAVCRGKRCVTEPKWYTALFMLKTLYPELVEWINREFYFKLRISYLDSPSNVGSILPLQTKED